MGLCIVYYRHKRRVIGSHALFRLEPCMGLKIVAQPCLLLLRALVQILQRDENFDCHLVIDHICINLNFCSNFCLLFEIFFECR